TPTASSSSWCTSQAEVSPQPWPERHHARCALRFRAWLVTLQMRPESCVGVRWRHRRLVVCDAQKEHRSAADHSGISKLSLAHESENSVLGVVAETMARVKPAGQEARLAGRRSSQIEHVKGAAGFEDAPDLTQCLLLLVLLEVMEHKGGEYS